MKNLTGQSRQTACGVGAASATDGDVLAAARSPAQRNGIPLLAVQPGATPVMPGTVAQLRDELPCAAGTAPQS